MRLGFALPQVGKAAGPEAVTAVSHPGRGTGFRQSLGVGPLAVADKAPCALPGG